MLQEIALVVLVLALVGIVFLTRRLVSTDEEVAVDFEEDEGAEEVEEPAAPARVVNERRQRAKEEKRRQKEALRQMREAERARRELQEAEAEAERAVERKQTRKERRMEEQIERDLEARRAEREAEEAAEYAEWRGEMATVARGEAAGGGGGGASDEATLRARVRELVQRHKVVSLHWLVSSLDVLGCDVRRVAAMLEQMTASGELCGVLDEKGVYVRVDEGELEQLRQHLESLGRFGIEDIERDAGAIVRLQSEHTDEMKDHVDIEEDAEEEEEEEAGEGKKER